ncbi:MAG: hypothetical protein JNL32_03025 [Candidatus Kapabacteria bacterium]|nr:hypothetical protein [Candidatus Kapabacteria bacterium]
MHTPIDHSVLQDLLTALAKVPDRVQWALNALSFIAAPIATTLSCLAALASLVLSIIKIIDHYKRRRHDKRNIR